MKPHRTITLSTALTAAAITVAACRDAPQAPAPAPRPTEQAAPGSTPKGATAGSSSREGAIPINPAAPYVGRDARDAATISEIVVRSSDLIDDPSRDGWDSEVFSQRAQQQLDSILGNLAASSPPEPAEFRGLMDETVRGNLLRPKDLDTVFDAGRLSVRRWLRDDSRAGGPSDSYRGVDGAVDAITTLHRLLAPVAPVKVKVKIVRVQFDATNPNTTVLLAASGHANGQSLQVSATLLCSWRRVADPSLPLLESMVVQDYEEVELRSESESWFREYTPSLMQDVDAYRAQLLHSCDYWAQRVETRLGANFMGYHGVSVGDANGDLLDDLLLCQPGGTPNLLLLQQPDGTLRDASAESGIDLYDACRCGLFVDLDNDGDEDLALSSITGTLLFENDGTGKFAFRERFREGRLGYSLAAADYDLDGDLDVYVCLYHAPPDAEVGNPLPYHDANNGSPNVLLSNDGDWKFHNATAETGLDQHNRRWSYAAGWDDFDNDGDPDLYVANDFGRNCLYRNDHGDFTDIAREAAVEDIASGMSVAWGDYNRDGWMDLYVSNMFSSAGGRVTYQRRFKSAAKEETRDDLQRLARGNSLFENRGDGSFRDVTLNTRVEMGRWAWSSNFCDLNNDGWEDIVVANGNYTGEDSGDL